MQLSASRTCLQDATLDVGKRKRCDDSCSVRFVCCTTWGLNMRGTADVQAACVTLSNVILSWCYVVTSAVVLAFQSKRSPPGLS